MSSEEQAEAYLEEAELTLASARAIFESADASGAEMWAQVVKNGYDAIEQAASAGIAAKGEAIPQNHPGKVNDYISLYSPSEEIEQLLLNWLQRRSSSQYVDVRDDEINIPHERFDREDAVQILEDAETVIQHVRDDLN